MNPATTVNHISTRPSAPVATFSNDSADFVGSLCRTPLGQTAGWGALLLLLGDSLAGTLLVNIQRVALGRSSCAKGCREEREIPSVPGLWVLLNKLSATCWAESHVWPASKAHRGQAHCPQGDAACRHFVPLSCSSSPCLPFPYISSLS